jgi:FkbM family methyltransferase
MSSKQKASLGGFGQFYLKAVRRLIRYAPRTVQGALRRDFASASVEVAIRSLQERGFQPRSIVDCGGFNGDWTRMVKGIFPDASVLIVEPQPDKEPFMKRLCADFSTSVKWINCLLGPEPRDEVVFHQIDGGGSSVLEEATSYPRTRISLRMRTLDEVLHTAGMRSADFLKLDVQGYEIEVLKGGLTALNKAQVVLLEMSFLEYNRSAPLFDEVVCFMKSKEFVVFDICNLQRWQEEVLLQADVLFVKIDSPYRAVDFSLAG